ncbi:MAG TPA: glycosyltransferase 87 family protein [Terracidiphilus sp.]|nr:glycosyltransferase 87 family protein [Terracidiphilus sp.]
MIHTGKSALLRWLERVALALVVLYFAVHSMPRAWGSLVTDFPNYYLAAQLAHQRFDTSRMYEWEWLEREKDHRGIPIRVIGLVPITPFSTLFVWPLTGLEPLIAKRVWILLSLALLLPLSWMLRQMTHLSYQRIALVFAISVPLYRNIEFGQFYVLLFFMIVAACWSYIRGWHALAGALIAIAAAAKIFPLLFFVFFLQRRAWRALAAAAITGAVTIALSVGVFGWNVHRTYLREILPAALHGEAMPPYFTTASFSGILHVLFLSEPAWNPRPWHDSVPAFSILLPVLSMLVLAPAILLIRREDNSPRRILLEWSALLTAALAVSTIPASYNFVLMAFPVCVLSAILLERKQYGWLAILLIAYLGIVGPIPVPAAAKGLAILIGTSRLPLIVAFLAGIYAMLWGKGAAGPHSRDWSRYAWAVVLMAAVAANIHSTWVRESGVRKEFAYRLPIQEQGYINAHPRSEAGDLRYVSFSLDGYHLITANDAGYTQDPESGSLNDDLSYTTGRGRLLVERALAPESVVVAPANPRQIVLQNAQDPMISADGETLAFLSEDRGRRQLMIHLLSAPSGQPDRTLTPPGLNLYEASFLSASEYAFAASDGSQPQIYLADATHANAPLGLGVSRYPALSPDGTWLAYSRMEGGVWNLWIRDQRTGAVRRIGNVPCNEIQPSWLADSKTVLYSTDCGRNLWFTAVAQRKVIP